ncbi:MAG: hypothetical protein K2I56_05570 [Muribaculaceae bacterium]|nr:hypothetical protein [Muribaculaceae bacterium]
MDLATLRARIKALENKNMPDSVSPMELADLYTALANLLEAVPDSTGDVARLRTSLDATAASLATLQRSFDSHKASAIVADSAGFLPLTQQRPALMDFYCKDDFNEHSHAPAAAAYAVRLDLRKPTEANFPEEVLYTPDNCIVYDVATTRFCHRKTWQYSANGMTHTVTEFRNRWVGCEAWGELGDDGVKPDNGRAYFCNPEQQVYVFARNYGITTSRFEPIQAMAAQLAELAAKVNASLNPDSAGFLPLAQQRPALMDFYCKDDFNMYSPGFTPTEDIARRLDLRNATETNYPEEVLYTPENCIVYDMASTRFCHRKIVQEKVPGYNPDIYRTVTEFRNRWVGCEAWGDLGDDGVKPDEGRLYYCNRNNMLYPFARNYGYNTYSFAPVAGAPAGTAATLEDDFMILEDEDNISPII